MADEAVMDEDALAREKAAADAAAANQDPLAAPVMQTMAAPAAVDDAANTAGVTSQLAPDAVPQTLQAAAVPGAPVDPRAMTNRFGGPGVPGQQGMGQGHGFGGMGGMMHGGILQRIAQMMAQRRQQFQQQMQLRQAQGGGRGPWGGGQQGAGGAPVLDASGQPVPGANPGGNTGFVPPWMRQGLPGSQQAPVAPPVASATANNPLPPGAAPAAQAAQTAAATQAAAPAPVPQVAPAPQQGWGQRQQQGGWGQQRPQQQPQRQQTNAQTQRAPGWANMLGGGFGRAQPQRQGGFANQQRVNPQSARQANPAATSSFAAPQPGGAKPEDDDEGKIY